MIKWRPRDTRNCLFKACENKQEIIVYDLETTGLNAEKDRVIQISGIKLRFDAGKFIEVERFDHYVNPEMPIPPKITEITGINDAMVFDKPTEAELFPLIKQFFGDNAVISGYNIAKFDNRFIDNLFKRNGCEFKNAGTTDILEMARDNVEKEQVENFKLGTIAALYGVDKGLTFHNSMDDVIASKNLVEVFYHCYKESFDEDEGLTITAESETNNLKVVENVHFVRYWDGYKGFARIYIGTNLGEFFYDVRNHLWNVNAKNNPYTVDEINMESLKEQAFKKCGAANEAEFIAAVTPKKQKQVIDITEVATLKYWKKTAENGKCLERIYVTTNAGDFYYDIIRKQWCSNNSNVNQTVDMEKLQMLCFNKAQCDNIDDFVQFCKTH